MDSLDKQKLKRLHTLLSNAKMMEAKRDLIHFYTNGRTESARELTTQEYYALIDHLLEHDSGERMRRKVFSLAYDIGIIHAHNDNVEEKKMNRAALDRFLIKNSYLHKSLLEYKISELPKLVSQMMQILKHDREAEARRNVKSLLNEIGVTSSNKK